MKITNDLQLNMTDCKRSMRVCISTRNKKKEKIAPIEHLLNNCRHFTPKVRDKYFNYNVDKPLAFKNEKQILLYTHSEIMTAINRKMKFQKLRVDKDGVIIKNPKNVARSIRRARTTLVDLAMVNDFEYFGTITINGQLHDIHNPEKILNKLLKFFNNYKTRVAPNFEYSLVPEYGEKNGRLHFHFLMIGIPEGDLFINEYKYLDWLSVRERFGHVQITKIGDTDNDRVNVAKYCAKYMSKDNIQIRSHRYFRSKGLKKPSHIVKYFPSVALAVRYWLDCNGYAPYSHTRYNSAFSVRIEDMSRFMKFVKKSIAKLKNVHLIPLPDNTLTPFDVRQERIPLYGVKGLAP